LAWLITAGSTDPTSEHCHISSPNQVGIQHFRNAAETSYPAKLGFQEFDVSNSYCEYVVEHAARWLTDPPKRPFLLTAGFFETHRPYPRDRYVPADADDVVVPDYLPDTADIRQDLAEFYGSISVADAAVGLLLDRLDQTGLDQTTWVVFMTDHGPALPRAKSTLYDAGTGIAMIVRPPRNTRIEPQVYDELFSGVDLVPTLLELLASTFPPMSTACRMRQSANVTPRHQAGAHRGLHDQDVSRLVRSDPRHPDEGIQLHRELRVAAPSRSAVGYRRKRTRPHRGATASRAATGARTVRP
jgi:arylsulfatase A-like enzyme